MRMRRIHKIELARAIIQKAKEDERRQLDSYRNYGVAGIAAALVRMVRLRGREATQANRPSS